MKTISRYIMTLALLLTAVGGAWAQGEFSSDPYTSTTELNDVSVTSSMTLTIKEGVIVTVNSGLTIEDGVTLTLTGGGRLSVYGKSGNWGRDAFYEEGNRIIEATAGGDGNPAIILNDNAKIVIDNGEIYAEGGQAGRGGEDATAGINKPDGAEGKAFSRFPTIDGATLYYKSSNEWFKYTSGDQTLYREMKALPPTFEVTLNDPKTEASFEMPTYDVNFSYELVRDMQDETNPVAFSGLPSSGKIIVKKGSDGKYQPAEALTIQLIDTLAAAEAQNIIAADGITIKVLVGAENGQGAIDYDHDNPITLEDFLADMKPGYYWIKAEPTDENSPYDGTVYSQEFLVSNGYELTIAAGEYATFYHNEKLYVEDEDAVLYTIANVTATEAQLSDAIKVAPAETPLLVYNKSEESKTFLLIPTTENADEVTPAKEFKGSLTEGEIPASSAVTDYYALNGKAFVWVKYAIEIGANKCWLQIGDQPAAARAMTRSITGGGDTTNMDDVRWQMEDGNYYDLNGRKVEKPNRKGIYIKNGQKVIVR
ncbi:MAG: hypothetical protein E7102_07790 [Prevotella ruminicola]|uniref:Uncharacterized protein n=1 Tax=Xylanibacter ruminicola TaxID=839 RepID=A0A928BSD4_XYLRU|nr:hypothetical protein [Xylanibacter ruminicola]